MGAIMTRQTPQEAVQFVKDFVRPIAPQSLIDEQALKLIGEPPERAQELLRDLQREVADGMASCNFTPGLSQTMIFGMSTAFADIVRERAIQLSNARGRA